MKIAKYLLFALMTSRLFGVELIYTFENTQITGDATKYFEFDIMIQAGASGTRIGDSQAYINYNTTAFGTNVVGGATTRNGASISGARITVTMPNDFYITTKYEIQLNDNDSNTFGITLQYTSPSYPEQGVSVPNLTNLQWAHVKMEISNQSAGAGLSFYQQEMDEDANQYSDNLTNYNPITATDTDDSSLPVQFAGISATAAEGQGITLTWRTESEVGSAGFNVWRSDDREGPYVKLTTQLIPSQGNSSSRQEYTFTDRDVSLGGEYWYKVEELGQDGQSTFFGPIRALGESGIPNAFALSANYPNPFNPETSFYYDLPQSATLQISVYSLLGEKITTLVDGNQDAGRYEVTWSGRDQAGNQVSSGIYFLVMDAGAYHQVRKMTLIR